MSIAGGQLGWSEEQFWKSSLPWFQKSVEGHRAFHGVDTVTPPDEDEIEEAKEQAKREGLL